MSLYAVTIEVPGEPIATARPRVTRYGNTYTPKRSLDAQKHVTAVWINQVQRGPLNWPDEPDRQYALRVIYRRGTFRRADLDNLLKTTLDGLTGYAWPDDSQVTRIVAAADWTPRQRGSAPSTLVQVRRLPRDMKGNPLPL